MEAFTVDSRLATEEFFFRGFLQTRLEQMFGSKWLVLVTASVFFGLYVLPYAYLHSNWPSAGDLGSALASSMGQGIPTGDDANQILRG